MESFCFFFSKNNKGKKIPRLAQALSLRVAVVSSFRHFRIFLGECP